MNKTVAPVSAWQLVRPGISLVRSHFVPLIYIALLPSLLSALGSTIVGNPIRPDGTFFLNERQQQGVGLMLIALLWTAINAGPLYRLLVDAPKHAPRPVLDYYRTGLRLTPRIILGYAGYMGAILGGLLLFIIPGILAFQRFLFVPYFLADTKSSFKSAFKESRMLGKKFSGPVWGVIGVQFFFTFLAAMFGSIALVGVLIAQLINLSVTFIVALRYRELTS